MNLGPSWKAIFDEETAKAYRKRIGNLTLLKPKENEAAGNNDFQTVKKPIYKATTYIMTNDVALWTDKWTTKAINERQVKLSQMAVRIWPLKVI